MKKIVTWDRIKNIARRLVYTCVSAATIVLILILAAPWLLELTMVYETPLEPVDVVPVSSVGSVLDIAIELIQQEKAKAILITKIDPPRFEDDPSFLSAHDVIYQQLLDAGIPQEAIYGIDRHSTTMLENQRVFRDWMYRNNMKSYVSFPAYYNSRFSKILHDDTFPNGEVKLICIPSQGNTVWRKQMLGIQNTMIRMIYWYMVYRPQIRLDNIVILTPSSP